jgi:hypothetical protein
MLDIIPLISVIILFHHIHFFSNGSFAHACLQPTIEWSNHLSDAPLWTEFTSLSNVGLDRKKLAKTKTSWVSGCYSRFHPLNDTLFRTKLNTWANTLPTTSKNLLVRVPNSSNRFLTSIYCAIACVNIPLHFSARLLWLPRKTGATSDSPWSSKWLQIILWKFP